MTVMCVTNAMRLIKSEFFGLCYIVAVVVATVGASGCSTLSKAPVAQGPFALRMKGNLSEVEKVSYFHRSRSTSFEDIEVRNQKEETLEFVSSASTAKVDAEKDRFTQVITVDKKAGSASLHDFAMPEVGEKLELTADSRGRILRAGDYPQNSIFYVPPVSLPEGPVSIGDTWAMQTQWLSLEEMVPYQLDMVSILKNVNRCGSHQCAEIEISGEVTLQGPLLQMMAFKSLWKGYLNFDIDAGTVLWSRVDSEEQFMSGNVRRSVTSCLEATLIEPPTLKSEAKVGGHSGAACATLGNPGDIAPVPGNMR